MALSAPETEGGDQGVGCQGPSCPAAKGGGWKQRLLRRTHRPCLASYPRADLSRKFSPVLSSLLQTVWGYG